MYILYEEIHSNKHISLSVSSFNDLSVISILEMLDKNNSQVMESKKPDKIRKRHAIRLFIGYEQDAQDLVKKFTSMKRKHNFQSTVDMFSWLLQIADNAEKPNRLPRIPTQNEAAVLKAIHRENKKIARRRKQKTPLKTPLKISSKVIKVEPDSDGYRLETQQPVSQSNEIGLSMESLSPLSINDQMVSVIQKV